MNNKGLRFRILAITCLAVGLPCVALADAPSNMGVGQVEAILNFCAKGNPGLEKDAKAFQTLLTGNVSPGVRSSAEYKRGYDLVTDELQKGNKAQLLAACAAGLALPKRGDHDHDEGHGRR